MYKSNEFPSLEQIRKGAFLRTLTHAIWIAKDSSLAYEYGWAGNTYLIQNSMGGYAAISFGISQMVGVFFDVHSSRNPMRESSIHHLSLLQGAPNGVLKLANEEALKYMLKEYNNLIQPAITAAFWATDQTVTAIEPWVNVVEHGGHLIAEDIFTNLQDNISKLGGDYDLPSHQIDLAYNLFNQKMLLANEPLLLNQDQVQILLSEGNQGEEESRKLLEKIGIVWS